MIKIVIFYHSFGGNTKGLAEYISTQLNLLSKEYIIDLKDIGKHSKDDLTQLDKYDKVLLGTFTWNRGAIPDQVKKFVKDNQELFQSKEIYLFGTGDTQFGGEALFCSAVDTLERVIKTNKPLLKIEQYYKGFQEREVKNWLFDTNLIKK